MMSKKWIRTIAFGFAIYLMMFITMLLISPGVIPVDESSSDNKCIILPWEICGESAIQKNEATLPRICQLLYDYNRRILYQYQKSNVIQKQNNMTRSGDHMVLMDQLNNSRHQHAVKGNEHAEQFKLLCWIMADPNLLQTKVIHQKQTWAKRCDKLLVMSSKENDAFPAIGLNVTEGRNHIGSKVLAAWKYIHKHYIEKYDFFIKTDPDTYVIVENLREFIKDKDPKKPHFFGHRFIHRENGTFTYMAGGSGLLLTRESVRRLVTQAFVKYRHCLVDGEGEDWKVCLCLTMVGCKPQDTRDSQGRERFLVLDIRHLVNGNFPDWYIEMDVDGSLKGDMCCSDYPISFHYVNKRNMYVLEYWLYHAKVHGKETVSVPWSKVLR